MNISYRWLTSLAPGLADPPERVAERLAMYGAPVDELVSIGEPIADIVIGRVTSVERHPNADRLSVCEVDAGTGEMLQVVCGAPNVRADRYYPFAPVGAGLPGGLTIRRARIRGVESQGMLCSERELGLGRDHAGIMELAGEFTPGEPFAPALGLDDVRIVVDVTPNRPDLLSHLGVARELAPGGEAGLRLPAFAESAGAVAESGVERVRREGTVAGVRVVLDDPRGCPRYMGAMIHGVWVGPSPAWLAARLRAVGLRPINNVVDATNYVLHELGQPLHAFDLDRLGGREVRIRRALPGESIVTLDGERRVLSETMLVIADADRPIAIAGVMGGEESEVTAATHDIFLECALFDPKLTRRTRTALGLATDASYRFERGVDPEGTERAMARALELIVTVAGGEVVAGIVDVEPEPREAPVIAIRPDRAAHVLGVPFDAGRIVALLEPLGFAPVHRSEDRVELRIPGHRWYDVEREVDLIEEVARRYGYDAFPDDLRPFRPSVVPDDELVILGARLSNLLVGRGFLEARTAPFAPERAGDVALLNPLSAAESRLRNALVPGLLRQVEQNFARAVRHVRLFELGTAFAPGDSPADPPIETIRIAAVFTGARTPPHWSEAPAVFDVWDAKTVLADLSAALAADAIIEPGLPAGDAPYEPALSFRLVDGDGHPIGGGGEVRRDAIDAPAWADPVWAVEILLRPEFARRAPSAFRAPPAYPAVERDAALIVPDSLPAARVEAVLRDAGGRLLEGVQVFDVFRGPGIPDGARSIAYRLRFRAPDRTLTDREVDDVFSRALRRVQEELDVGRRT